MIIIIIIIITCIVIFNIFNKNNKKNKKIKEKFIKENYRYNYSIKTTDTLFPDNILPLEFNNNFN